MSTYKDREANDEDVRYVGGLIKRISNFDPDRYTNVFNERMKFQKTVYLIQAFDIPLGFSFNWHVRGPYSPAVADVGFAFADTYDEVSESEFTEEQYEQRFQEFQEYVSLFKNDTEKLEATASLHFLWKKNKEVNRDVLIDYLLGEKDLPETDFQDCEEYWQNLVDYRAIGN